MKALNILTFFALMLIATIGFAQSQTVTISSTAGSSTNAAFVATITFSGSTATNFTVDDISATNAILSDFDATNNPIFTATVTPTTEGAVTLDVAANVCDEGNDAATQFSINYDATVPTLSSVTITSSNANNTLAKSGDVITLQFTASETISTPTVNIAGSSIVPSNTSGNTWVATYTTTASTSEGTIAFAIDYADLAGNTGSQVTNLTFGGTNVTCDNTAPTLSSVTIASSNANSALAKSGDVITLQFTANEAISAPTVNIAGNSPTTLSNTSGNTWVATYTTDASTSEGTIAFAIDYADLAGNAGSQVTSSNFGGTNVTCDKTAPTLSSVTITSSNANSALAKSGDVITLQFTANEAISAPTVNIAGNSPTTLSNTSGNTWVATYTTDASTSEGTIAFAIDYADLAGNAGSQVTSSNFGGTNVSFDKTVPTLSSVTITSSNAYNTEFATYGETVTLTFTASETINTPTVKINNSTVVASYSSGSYTASTTLTGSLNITPVTFKITFDDLAGNSGTTVTETTDGSLVNYYINSKNFGTITIASNNTHSKWAKVGNTITIAIEDNYRFQKPTVTITENTTTVNSAGDCITSSPIKCKKWKATYQMQNTDAEGNISLQISAGNYITKTTTTDGSKVTFDKTTPELYSVTASSDNSYSSSVVSVGGKVTIAATGSENIIIDATSTIAGQPVDAISGTGRNWNMSYTLQDGNITENSSTVPFSLVFADSAGNSSTATAITNGNNVTYNNSVPTLSNVSIKSNNTNTTLAKVGDVVTLSFTASEVLSSTTVTILGNGVVASHIGSNVWKAQYTLSNANTEGQIPFTIDFKNTAGNAGTRVSSTTDATSVTFDRTNPSLNSVTIQSGNANTSLAKNGDEITLSFTSSETIKTPEVTINGTAANSITNSGNNWTAKRSIGDETSGAITFSITISDLAGNSPTPITATTDGSNVTIDNNAPIVSLITVPSGLYKVGDAILATIYTDGSSYSGTSVTINGKNTGLTNNNNKTYSISYTVAEGDTPQNRATQLPITLNLTDAAGNITSASQAGVIGGDGRITIDTSTPVISSVSSTATADGILGIGSTIDFTIQLNAAERYLNITPTTYNGQTLNWATANNGLTYTSQYVVAEGNTNQRTPLQLGEVTVTDTVGNTCSLTNDDIKKLIFGTRPSAQISGTQTKCYDGQTEYITINFTGTAPYSISYKLNGTSKSESDITTNPYTISLAEGTVELISVTDSTTNTYTLPGDSNSATITVNSLPSVTLNITSSPYSFEITTGDELSQYIEQTDKRTGTFTGLGVTAANGKYYFYPSLIPESSRDIDIAISYTYTDATTGCATTATDQIMVSNSSVSLQMTDNTLCLYQTNVEATGAVPNDCYGQFSVTTANNEAVSTGWSSNDGHTLYLSPKTLGIGNYIIKYTAFKTATSAEYQSTTKNFSVEGKVTGYSIAGLQDSYCFDSYGNDVPITISGISQTTGDAGHFWADNSSMFTTTTDAHTAKFKLASAIANSDYTIYYCYESTNGCYSDTISKKIHINPLPELTFTLPSNFNYSQEAYELSATPAGGTFSANTGISNTGATYYLNPSQISNTGSSFNITYTYTDPTTQCTNSISTPTKVYKATEKIGGLNSFYCYANSTFNITCQSINETSTGAFSSTRNALTNTSANNAEYSLAKVGGNQTDTVSYNYKIDTTSYSVYTIVKVDSIGTVEFSENILTDSILCKNDASFTVRVEVGHKNGSGAFTWTGDQNAISEAENKVVINPTTTTLAQGKYTLSYTYTSSIYNQCKSTISKNLYVYNIPTPTFDASFPSYFASDGDTVNLVNYVSPIASSYLFSGINIINDTLLLPKVVGTGDHALTYTVTDTHGCKNSTTANFGVIGADVTFSNNPKSICVYEPPITIYAKPQKGINGTFSGNGITTINDTTATFNPSVAGYVANGHTITYTYTSTYDNKTQLNASFNLDVIDLGKLTINLPDSTEFCHNDDSKQIVIYNNSTELMASQVNFSGYTQALQGPTNNHFYLSPTAAGIGYKQIGYSYTNNGCTISDTITVIVKPIPNPHFNIKERCIDFTTEPIKFINYTDTSAINGTWKWLWTLKDGILNVYITDYNAENMYSSTGTKQVIMQATANGCSNSIDSTITVEYIPNATFSLVNECAISTTPSKLIPAGNSLITSYKWIVDGVLENETSSYDTLLYSFSEGLHQVQHVIEINNGECSDTVTKQITIQPHINVAALDNSLYSNNFEVDNGAWIARSIKDGEYSSWQYGLSDAFTTDTNNIGKSWYTNINYPTQNAESSELVSPCFDFTSLQNPMIKLNIWSWPEKGRDGAVFQYSLDQGQTWANLGEVDEGISWFNSSTIKSQPGGTNQFTGWSGDAMTDWQSARLNTNNLKGQSNVRFRIAYAADANAASEFHGFALNNFWIGDKQQNVLFEYFTNNNLGNNLSYYSDVMQANSSNTGYFTPIHYHTDYPSGDALYSYYPSGPISREFYYGISAAPYAVANGESKYSFTSTANHTQNLLNLIDKQSLTDPKVHIEVTVGGDINGCNVSTTITALQDISNQNIALFSAVVKDSIEIDGETYYNVLRDFIPDAGGTIINNNIAIGQQSTISTTWTPRSATDITNSTLVTFVQNIETNEIYQTVATKISGINSIADQTSNIAVLVYPNPASSAVTLTCDYQILQVEIIDATGKTMLQIQPNALQQTIDVQNIPAGLYLIKGRTGNGSFVKKLIKK